MKTLTCLFSLGTLLLISSCTTVEERRPATQTTTTVTEESSFSRAQPGGTIETQTTRSY